MFKQSTKAILFFLFLIPATGLFVALLLPQMTAIEDPRPVLYVFRWFMGIGIFLFLIPSVLDMRCGIGSLFRKHDSKGWKWFYRSG
jgi:hypothetical protein